MVQPWVGLVSALAAVVVGLVVVWTSVQRRRRRPGSNDAAIANVHRADASPVFRRLRRRYHLLLGGEVAALSIVGLAAVGLTMRPVTDRQLERDVRNRDVMLCLDVSTSMNELDAIVLREFVKLAAGLRGERIGLTIFNGSAITVFPLTDDAEFIESTLEEAAQAISGRKRTFVEGTEEGTGTSLIGDGLASCAMRFDSDERGRSQSDRVRHGQRPRRRPDPAAPRSRCAGPRAGDPGVRHCRRRPHHRHDADELRAAAESTGGAYFETDGRSTIANVVAEVGRMEATRMDVPPEVVADDRPTEWIVACFAGLAALFAVGWALRR